MAGKVAAATELTTKEDVVQEGGEAGASVFAVSPIIEESWLKVAIVEVDVFMVEKSEESSIIASATSEADVSMAKPAEERHLEVAGHEVVAEMDSPTDMPFIQLDEGGPSGTVSSPITVIILKSIQISSGRPPDITSSSGTVLEHLTSAFAKIPGLVTIPILSVIVLQLVAEIIDETSFLGRSLALMR